MIVHVKRCLEILYLGEGGATSYSVVRLSLMRWFPGEAAQKLHWIWSCKRLICLFEVEDVFNLRVLVEDNEDKHLYSRKVFMANEY